MYAPSQLPDKLKHELTMKEISVASSVAAALAYAKVPTGEFWPLFVCITYMLHALWPAIT